MNRNRLVLQHIAQRISDADARKLLAGVVVQTINGPKTLPDDDISTGVMDKVLEVKSPIGDTIGNALLEEKEKRIIQLELELEDSKLAIKDLNEQIHDQQELAKKELQQKLPDVTVAGTFKTGSK